MVTRKLMICAASATMLTPLSVGAQTVPTSPPVNFVNESNPAIGSIVPKLLDSYVALVRDHPEVLVQNYNTVITLTKARTTAQTLNAIHDDRTNQAYSILNGLGALTNLYMAGAGASTSGNAPTTLTPTSYAAATLADYVANINLGNSFSPGSATFANGTATPLAGAVNFINNTVRANSSTEPAKRTFARYQGTNPPIDPLDPRFANYNVNTNRGALTAADTAAIIVPSFLSSYTVPAPYATTTQWVRGFTVTAAMIAANGGNPITAPNLGSFDAAGKFTAATFKVGEYVPGIGASPRPYRVSGDVNVPAPMLQIINSTNPYADGAYPSGHTNSGLLQALGTAFLIPQQGQELLARAADLGTNRILAGMHSPLDIMGARIEATALAATNIYAALYDAKGNRLDWTNPANAGAYAVYQAYTQTQAYLASACGTATVTACIAAATASGATAADPFGNAAQNKATYLADMTYGFAPIGPVKAMTAAEVPVQAQVLLLTRFGYLTDAQRTEILATTALPSGYPVLTGNTLDGWGQLNLYAANDGYGAFNGQVAVTMDAAQGGYAAADSWSNDIGGSGGLTKNGTGSLTLTGKNTYAGPTIVNGGTLAVTGSSVSATTVNGGVFAGTGTTGAVTVNSGILQPGLGTTPGTLTINGGLTLASGATLVETVSGALASRTIVSGAAALGGTVRVQGTPTALPVTRIALVTAAGGVTGSFAAVTGLSATQRGVIDYSANAATLNLNRTDIDYRPLGITANQRAVAGALTTALPAASGVGAATALNAVYATGQASSAAGAALLDRLSGEGLADANSAALFTGRMFGDAVTDQQRAVLTDSQTHLWGGPLGGREWTDGRTSDGTADRRSNAWGGLVGLDGEVSPGLRAGFVAGGLDTRFNTTARATKGKASSFHVSAYSSFALPTAGSYWRGSVAYGHYAINTTRIAGGIGGVAAETETARYNASELRLRGEIGQRVATGSFDLTPFLAAEFARLDTNGFAERGGALALQADRQRTTSLPVSAGLRVSGAFPFGNGLSLRPMIEGSYSHEFRRNRDIGVDFVSLADTAFTIEGARPSQSAFVGKAGVQLPLAPTLVLYATGTGVASSQQRSYAGNLGVRIGF
ncbi:autotransporter domain-containing protein [Sphingomonas sp. R86521]|uniref:autotransporter family protein n=1 Tax=Sphingomonas sp. R86521 TaxID=3093860 RepID=UPI0036D272F3